ncbi:unnamed protein product [Allacma fusca]|uniref:Uncharacterized protein n=1 Tax=Allacma fusca TaxID=39272 RepID=A0A8J2PQ42_9HEXA|nr:unnamed protein product [Allacma fusca]
MFSCDAFQTSLHFNGEICENGRRIEMTNVDVATAWYCCSDVPFDDVRAVASISITETTLNVSMSLRHLTTPPFEKDNLGKSGVLYSYVGQVLLSKEYDGLPMTYLWEDTIVSGGNNVIVRRHECELYLILPNDTTTEDPSINNTTDSSALTFYAINNLFLLISFLTVALILEK